MKQSFEALCIISLVVETKKCEKNPVFVYSFFFRFELTVALKHVNGNAEEVVRHGNVGFHPQIDSKFRTNIWPP